jgi:predicted PurR-regulated permease PerM
MNEAWPRDLPRTILALALLGGLILLSMRIMSPFVPALTWAAMIAVSTWPIMLGVQRRLGGRRGLAVAVMTIVLLLIFVVPLSMAIAAIVDHVDEISGWARSLAEHQLGPPPDWLHKVPMLGERLVAAWQSLAADGNLSARVSPYIGGIVSWFVSQLGSLGAGIGQLLLTVAIAGILFAKGEVAARGLFHFARRLGGERGEASVRLAGQAIRGVALGVVVTALVQAGLGAIGLAVVGIPALGMLTAIMFMLALAQIGVVPVMAGGVIWEYAHGNSGWGTALLVWTILVASVDNVIRPILIKRGANLPLLLIFSGVVGGLMAFGLVGIFVGPAVLAVTWKLFSAWVLEGQTAADPPDAQATATGAG